MNSEMEIVIAFLFKRSGKNKLKESEIYLPLSIDLGWFSTKESHEFINLAIKQNLLIKKDDFLVPSFDIGKIHIPLGFYPSKKKFLKTEKSKIDNSITNKIVKNIVEKENLNYEDIIEQIKEVASEKDILLEVAALLVAKQYNIDIGDFLNLVEKNVLTENGE